MTKRNLIWAGVLLLVSIAVILLTRPPAPGTANVEEFPQLHPVVETYRLITTSGYCPGDDAQLVQGAVAGMAEAADEYSAHIPPDEAASFRRRIEGADCGVGLELETSAGLARIVQVVYDTPAGRGGLKGGEVVLAVDGAPADEIATGKLNRVVNHGPEGSEVELAVMDRRGEVRTVTLNRRVFRVASVTGFYRDEQGRWTYLLSRRPTIALLRVREFVRGTAGDVQAALRQMDGLDALILDLRDNPGGQLPSAAAVADLFLADGPIFALRDKTGTHPGRHARSQGTYSRDLRVAVLVNGSTASAAEIVAGALACNHRAVLVGTRTRGKGLIQSVLQLPADMGEVNLTTAEFLLGDGTCITRRPGSDTWGVDPHVTVEMTLPQRAGVRRLWLQAETPQIVTGWAPTQPANGASARRPPATTTSQAAPLPARLLELDTQLRRAMELLGNVEEYDALLAPSPAAADRADAVER